MMDGPDQEQKGKPMDSSNGRVIYRIRFSSKTRLRYDTDTKQRC